MHKLLWTGCVLLPLFAVACNDGDDDDDDATNTSPPPTQTGGPDIVIDRGDVDFGLVPIGITSSARRTVTNAGDDTLTISYSLAGGSAGSDVLFQVRGVGGGEPPAAIEPGASADLEFTFTPVEVTDYEALLSLSTNDEDDALVQLRLVGTGYEEDTPRLDEDQDGSPADEDCDDAAADVYPGAPELCDGIDNDCDEELDEDGLSTWYSDSDGDGHGDPGTAIDSCAPEIDQVSSGDDCDDTAADVYPDASETCDGRDQDCDLEADDGALLTFYADADQDGYGDEGAPALACDAPEGHIEEGGDCNDDHPEINPAAIEVCNAYDDNCDGEVDEDIDQAFYPDADGDGFGDASGDPVLACSAPAGHVANATDCDDTAASSYPGAAETCNGEDDDCDSQVDDGVQLPWYVDADADGHGLADDSGSAGTLACTQPAGYVATADDCDDDDADVYTGAIEACDGKDNDCDDLVDEDGETAFFRDVDGDRHGDPLVSEVGCSAPGGYVAAGDDCNDRDGAVYPGATEQCNAKDDDCDAEVDEGATTAFYLDADRDGYGDATAVYACTAPDGRYVTTSGDCDDLDAKAYPGALERCDGVDDDCDGTVDEGVKTVFYQDTDGDGYGVTQATRQACTVPAGYAAQGGDCDDADTAVNPGAAELCNSKDDDCDAQVDEGGTNVFYLDADKDGYGDALVTTQACNAPAGYVSSSDDCNDRDATAYPGATETCDGVVDDCDGTKDEGVTTTWYLDADKDGYGDPDEAAQACSSPGAKYTTTAGDCDDLNVKVYPGAIETCNGLDDDCDGAKDESFDADADGTSDCVDDDKDGVSEDAGDCDDLNAATYPKAPEVQDGEDNDCDGRADQTTRVVNFDTYPDGSAVATGAQLQQQYGAWGVYFRTDGTTTTPPTVRTTSGYGFSQPTSGKNALGSDTYNSAGIVAYFAPELYVTKVSLRDTDDDCTTKTLYAFDESNNMVASMLSNGTCHAGGARPTLTVAPVDSAGRPVPIVRVEFDTTAGPSGGSYDGTYFTIDDFTFSYYMRDEQDSKTRFVDFEFGANDASLTANSPLTSQYSPWGVAFGTDGSTSSPATIRSVVGIGFLRPSSGMNALGSDQYNSAGLVATFDTALFVYRVSIRDVDDDSTVKTLFAFDAAGNVIGSAQSKGTGDPKAPLPIIQVAPVDSAGKPVRIYKVEFDTQAGTAGGSADGTYFTIDDLSFSYFD